MPQDQGELWHLLALLAQLEEGRLARVGLHELRNPLQDALVLLRHDGLAIALNIVRRSTWNDATARHRVAVVASHAREVLLLRGSRSDRSSLRLRLMRLELSLLLVGYMVGRVLLVVLRPLAGVLLLVRVDVLHLQAIVLRCRGGSCAVLGRID